MSTVPAPATAANSALASRRSRLCRDTERRDDRTGPRRATHSPEVNVMPDKDEDPSARRAPPQCGRATRASDAGANLLNGAMPCQSDSCAPFQRLIARLSYVPSLTARAFAEKAPIAFGLLRWELSGPRPRTAMRVRVRR